jgi:hypothetical protein
MPNKGAVAIIPGATAQLIPAGYHNGSGSVAGDGALQDSNIKVGTTIFTVAGTFTSDATATATDILESLTAYANGSKLTGTRLPAPPGKTGQTTSYTAGDDGDLQKGAASTGPRFTDNRYGTVTDNKTGLIWLKNANCPGALTWVDALRAIDALNLAVHIGGDLCGDGGFGHFPVHHTDWRLPNRFEMESLLDLAYVNPAISNTDGTTGPCGAAGGDCPFTGIQNGWYWTSSTSGPMWASAWCVDLASGGVYNLGKTLSYYVWPVRGGQ